MPRFFAVCTVHIAASKNLKSVLVGENNFNRILIVRGLRERLGKTA